MQLVNGEYTPRMNGVEHWIKVEGAENHTTPLVIIHGGPGGNLFVFERTTGPQLSRNKTVIYYEQRGCGRSGSPDSDEDFSIKHLLSDFKYIHEWLGFEKVDLFGYSFGGELALEITHAFPEKVNKVILSCPSLIQLKTQYLIQMAGFMSVGESAFISEIESILENPGSIEEKYLSIWKSADISTIDRLFFEDQDLAQEYRRISQDSKMNNTGLMLKAIHKNPPSIPLIDRLEEIKNDILILTGVHDRNTGIMISNLIHSRLTNSNLVLFSESAHFPFMEEQDWFLENVELFLK